MLGSQCPSSPCPPACAWGRPLSQPYGWNAAELSRMKRDPECKVTMATSRRSSYLHHPAVAARDKGWHGDTHEDPNGKPFLTYLERTKKRAVRATRHREGIRLFHNRNIATHSA